MLPDMAWDQERLEGYLIATAQRDRESFVALYEYTSSHLFAIVMRILRDRSAAEDTLQDVFMSVWDKAGSYHHERGRAIDWLRRIAHNAAIDEVRRNARRPQTVAELDPDLQISESGDPVAGAISSASNAKLLDCLATIGNDHRESLLKAYVYGFTSREIATEKGVAIGTVKSWVSRGLARLRECLN